MFHGLKQKDYSTGLDVLNLWTLEKRRNRADLIELFKTFKLLSGIAGDELFERASNARSHTQTQKALL